MGHIDDVEHILKRNEIEEVIIALESVEHDRLKTIISRLEGGDVRIKILPDMYDILSGTVEMSNIFGALLISVNAEVMPVWQRTFKRLIDIIASSIALIVLTTCIYRTSDSCENVFSWTYFLYTETNRKERDSIQYYQVQNDVSEF